ncbi:Bifunctional NMN adenylyltransferase/Nudix hydrolase [Chromobacterium violaceum]|nr:Bifunctional NMN adenylyltransferase/Nudix hydrolase [Chromobacterium violaceum]
MGDRRLAVARFCFPGGQLEEFGQCEAGLPLPAAQRKQRASIVIIENGRLLLMRRVKPGKEYYVLPGGNIKRNETPAMACVRETREETGLNVWLEEGPLCVLESESRTEHVFVAREHRGMLRLGGPELAKLSPDNHYELVWLDAEALAMVKLRPKSLRPHCLARLGAANGTRA